MIVYGRSNGKALRSALNSMTEVRNGYIYAAATGERIAKIGNTIMMSLQEVLLIMGASFGNKKAKKELRQREIRDRQKQIIRSRRRQQLLRENQDKRRRKGRLDKNVFCIGRLVFLSNEFWIGLLVQLVVYGVSIGVIYGVMRTRLDYIEKKLDKHNNVAERVYKLEADSKVVFEKISVENNRIKDLEGWQKHEQEKE